MTRSYPPDVVVLDNDGLLHARISRGKKPSIVSAKTYPLRDGIFTPAQVTPDLADPGALAEVVRRLRLDAGRVGAVSMLLPDAWFRINLVDLPALSDKQDEALHAVRWTLKRTLPMPPESLRIAWHVLGKSSTGLKLLVVSAVEKSLAAIESAFAAAGVEIVVIEPLGLNVWNAITARENATQKDRLFVYIRDTDFTAAVFRGAQPVFVRSRNLSGQRTLEQEIRLSANYLRETVQAGALERAYVAGRDEGGLVESVLASEFAAPVVPVRAGDYAGDVAPNLATLDAELIACTGVFAG